jgi:hypothetical protein
MHVDVGTWLNNKFKKIQNLSKKIVLGIAHIKHKPFKKNYSIFTLELQ